MNAGTALAARVDQYLAERRQLGFKLGTTGYALHSLVEHVRRCQHHGPLTLELMARWAPRAKQGPGDRATWARRLDLLRPFTRWLCQFEPDTEVPDEPIFGRVPGRVAPHIYNDEEIAALLDAAGRIGPPSSPRGAVVQTVFGLMACTGLRVSEALALTDADIDWKAGVLTVRDSKCRHSRLVPLHPSAVSALRHYRAERDRYVASTPNTPLFIACRGRRLGQPFCGRQLKRIFDELRRRLGGTSRGGRDMPRLHDLRHTFAVRRLLARLAALRAFLKFAARRDVTALHAVEQALGVPLKRFERPMIGYLTREEMLAVIGEPGPGWTSQRDHLLLRLLYNTGARVSEIIGVKRSDVVLDGAACVHLHGKGRKQRTVPLWRSTVRHIRAWLRVNPGLGPAAPLLPNRGGLPMTRGNVTQRLALAVKAASIAQPQLLQRRISPHTIRHTTAMHLLQSGTRDDLIALWLGHESPVTTHQYVEADLAMKEQALARVQEPAEPPRRFRASDSLLAFLKTL